MRCASGSQFIHAQVCDIPVSRPGLETGEVGLWGLRPHLWYCLHTHVRCLDTDQQSVAIVQVEGVQLGLCSIRTLNLNLLVFGCVNQLTAPTIQTSWFSACDMSRTHAASNGAAVITVQV